MIFSSVLPKPKGLFSS